ncbi:MCE family protein [Actinomadura sp. GC306]|uniref:MCE family protein n=1 Tax=Actinomadura sp. GC306 TaxID=2530367 RepID=UPI00104537F8|nr:MCE family protein [Actinomadura sp. GC306]TDC66103.1 MCE family protein [Actinomadura sp. GC306]
MRDEPMTDEALKDEALAHGKTPANGWGRYGAVVKRSVAAVTALALTASLGGCGMVGEPTYSMTVYFPSAPSLYKDSQVKVMGADAGTITSIKSERNRVRVDFEVKRTVPVPAEAHAAIEAADALGERFVSLHPVWKPGMPKAKPGTVIPQERTELPIEIDDALAAFAKLNESIDGSALGPAVNRAAESLRGRGDGINDALHNTSELTRDLAAQDKRIVSLADGLHSLAADLNARDRKLSDLLRSFSSTGRTLAQERQALRDFIAGLAAAIRKSEVLVTAYRETLPSTVADLSNIILTLKGNVAGLTQAIDSLGRFANVAIDAWDRRNHVATIRVVVHGTVRAWLQPLFTAMGWGTVPCVEGNQDLGDCAPAPGGP